MTKRTISNTDDIIDSRDVIARISELEDERDNYAPGDDDADDPEDTSLARIARVQAAWAEANPDDAEELKALTELAEEADGAADWTYGETLIRDSYFETYAQDLAEDIGAVNKDATWPNNYIDWEAATDALKQDYTEVDFDGVAYWIRM